MKNWTFKESIQDTLMIHKFRYILQVFVHVDFDVLQLGIDLQNFQALNHAEGNGTSALHAACRKGKVKVVQFFLQGPR